MIQTTSGPRVVALDDGYASYDQEEELLAAVGARFELRPVRCDRLAARDAVAGADVVLVRESPVDASVIQGMDRCRAIIRYGIGVDNIDQDAARARRIMVVNVPDYGIEEVSTHAVALLLAVVRQIGSHDSHVRQGRWHTGILRPMHRLAGRTLGLVGYGRIAQLTHRKLSGFDFGRVLIHDPALTQVPQGTERVDLDTLCRESDVISLHAPATAATRHLINAERLAGMRSTAILINTSRGSLVDLDALHDALLAGRMQGAGLDVFDPEPPPPDHPILRLDSVVLSNHISWYSEESMRDLQRKAAEEAVRVLAGSPPLHWLNRW